MAGPGPDLSDYELIIEGELVDTEGTLIATASGVFKRVPEDSLAGT